MKVALPALGLLTLAWAPCAHAEVLRHALVVGVNDGGGALEPLKYAEQDARRFAELLVEIGAFDAEMVTVLYSPDQAGLLSSLAAHEDLARDTLEDFFLFYYSGHADTRGLRLGHEILDYEDLRASIRTMPAEVRVGVLDACRSGAMARLKGARITAPFLVEDDELAAEGEAWLMAATADESAQESDQIRGSFFTHYLVSGMRGAADNGDGLVSLDEIYRYAYQRTVARTGGTEGGTQHPVYDFRLQGQGDLFVTDVRRALAQVTFPPEIEGDLTVLRLPDRTPVAEIAKPQGESVNLALAPGKYLIRRRSEAGLQDVTVTLNEGSATTVARFGAPSALELTQLKGLPTIEQLSAISQDLGRFALESQRTLQQLDLRHSAPIAGGLSLVVPGAGQAYNGHWTKGGLLFLGTAALFGGGILWQNADSDMDSGSLMGSNMVIGVGAALYGFSVADAVWQVHKQEKFRPKTGWVVLTETGWEPSADEDWPSDTGIAVDWIIEPHFSLGLDRTGLVTHKDGTHTFGMGSRMTLGADHFKRLRPGAFVALGFRAGTIEKDVTGLRPAWSLGANLRWYLTPRYLVEFETRNQWIQERSDFIVAAGIGVHLGR